MMRAARVSTSFAMVICAASLAQAQTPAADADRSSGYAEIAVGATFGHKSSGSIGAEAGWRVADEVDVFFEGGHIRNAGTQGLDDRAAIIANAFGASFSAAYKVNYFDGGVRYHFKTMQHDVRPYLAVGLGVARVRAETVLSINGTAVTGDELGIQFGNDLNGSISKPIFVIAAGAAKPFGKRYVADLSYRYGRIFPRTGEIPNDTGINTNRLQLGVGVRF
jgi:opacity protein-like surface antigen